MKKICFCVFAALMFTACESGKQPGTQLKNTDSSTAKETSSVSNPVDANLKECERLLKSYSELVEKSNDSKKTEDITAISQAAIQLTNKIDSLFEQTGTLNGEQKAFVMALKQRFDSIQEKRMDF